MSTTYLTGLDVTAYSVGGGSQLALLKNLALIADNDQQDGAGLSDRYEVNQVVKQGQTWDFTSFFPSLTSGLQASNLDVTLWSIGGTAFLGLLRSGSIEVTTVTKERSGIAAAYKFPNPTRTKIQVSCDLLTVTNGTTAFAEFANMLTDTVTGFNVAVAITFAGEAYVCPMNLKYGKATWARDEMTMENLVLTGQGTPTGPSDSTLLGNTLIGTGLVALDFVNSGGEFKTGSGQSALITRLSTQFSDAQLIEQTGTFAIQGAMTYIAP